MKRVWILAMVLILFLPAISCVENESETGDSDSTAPNGDFSGDDSNAAPAGIAGDAGDPIKADLCEKVPLDEYVYPDITLGDTTVDFDSEGFFTVNSVRYFPYGFYGYPSDEDDIDEFVAAGFNTTVIYGSCCQGDTLAGQVDTLAFLKENGVLAAPHAFSPVSQIYSEETSTLQSWIDQRDAAGSILFWYTYDEPGIWSIPYAEVEDYHELLGTLDADHPDGLVMAPGEDYTNYSDATTLLMIDPYPVPVMPLSQVKYAYLEAKEAVGEGRRVMGVPQAFDWYVMYGTAQEGHQWRPLVYELRNMTYQYIVFGANGMVAFAYTYVHEQADRWEGLKGIAAEVTELLPIILTPDSDIEIVEEEDLPYVDHALREVDGLYYLIVVSTWTNDLTVHYDLSPLGADLCVVDYFSEQTLPVESGALSVDLTRADARVFQIIVQE